MACKRHLTNASPAGKHRVLHAAGATPWVKRRQGVCGPEQAGEREIIAPQSLVVEAADLVPHKGRQHQQKRSRVSRGWLFRGSDPQHADKGTFVDWGEPAASETAHTLDR